MPEPDPDRYIAPDPEISGDDPPEFRALDLDADPSPLESADSAQPSTETRVDKDMATIALEPAQSFAPATGVAVPADKPGENNDAELMLRVREGDDGAYSYLVEKYRKPIIHFMFRMVRNQAVAD